MKNRKKLLSIIFSLALIIGMIPMTALAEERKTCTVTFDLNGAGKLSQTSRKAAYESFLFDADFDPWECEDETLVFAGWYTEDGEEVKSTAVVDEEFTGGNDAVTLYAQWKPEGMLIGRERIELGAEPKFWLYDESASPVIQESEDRYNLAWNPKTHTLELKDLSVTEHSGEVDGGIFGMAIGLAGSCRDGNPRRINLKLTGTSSITLDDTDENVDYRFGIYSYGRICFTGNGTLNVSVGSAENSTLGSFGMAVVQPFVTGECRVNLKSPDAALLMIGTEAKASVTGSNEPDDGAGLQRAVPGTVTVQRVPEGEAYEVELATYVPAAAPTEPCRTLVIQK